MITKLITLTVTTGMLTTLTMFMLRIPSSYCLHPVIYHRLTNLVDLIAVGPRLSYMVAEGADHMRVMVVCDCAQQPLHPLLQLFAWQMYVARARIPRH